MKRRLYFLLPEPDDAVRLLDELRSRGVKLGSVHALANDDVDISHLPLTRHHQRSDVGKKIARLLWDADLWLFFIALLALVLMILQQVPGWTLIIPITIMAVTFALGTYYVQRIHDTHLDDFRGALKHQEVLLMINIEKKRLHEIQNWVRKTHLEAATGGVGWVSKAMHH